MFANVCKRPDLRVEAARPAQRGVHRVEAVRRADDVDLAAAAEAVHEGEQRLHLGWWKVRSIEPCSDF